MHTWQAWPQKPPELPSASSSVLKYLYGQEGFVPDVSSKGSLLPCELISACHPAENTKISFLIFLAFFCIARLLSPLTSVLSSLGLNWSSCSCLSQMLFWALAHSHCPSLHGAQAAPDFSLCCTRARPSSGEKLWLLTGPPAVRVSPCVSQQRKFCEPLLAVIHSLHLCVQSLLSMCDRTHRYISMS